MYDGVVVGGLQKNARDRSSSRGKSPARHQYTVHCFSNISAVKHHMSEDGHLERMRDSQTHIPLHRWSGSYHQLLNSLSQISRVLKTWDWVRRRSDLEDGLKTLYMGDRKTRLRSFSCHGVTPQYSILTMGG